MNSPSVSPNDIGEEVKSLSLSEIGAYLETSLAIRQTGLSVEGAALILCASEAGGESCVSKLSEMLRLPPARLSRLASLLEDSLLVGREVPRADRRRVTLFLTDAGWDKADEAICALDNAGVPRSRLDEAVREGSRLRAFCASQRLSFSQALCLAALYEGGGTASEIAKRVAIKRTTAFEALRSLLGKGLVCSARKSRATRFERVP